MRTAAEAGVANASAVLAAITVNKADFMARPFQRQRSIAHPPNAVIRHNLDLAQCTEVGPLSLVNLKQIRDNGR
jgi:hypothetical protein